MIQTPVLLLSFLLVSSVLGFWNSEGGSESESLTGFEYVTCGSVIRLKNQESGYFLHSHEITYGSGSGQQSVTSFPENGDSNSLWAIRAPHGQHCPLGKQIKKGDTIRLQHVNTQKYLHSHLHKSPLSKEQEVSCYGGPSSGGDSGDNWRVVVPDGKTFWTRDAKVSFIHVDTEKYLRSNSKNKFNNPIPGQLEVFASSKKLKEDQWQAQTGFYFSQPQETEDRE